MKLTDHTFWMLVGSLNMSAFWWIVDRIMKNYPYLGSKNPFWFHNKTKNINNFGFRKITARPHDYEHDNIWGVEILVWKNDKDARGTILNEDGMTQSFATEIARRISHPIFQKE